MFRKIYNNSNFSVPDWLYESVKSKIENSSLLKKEDINILIVNTNPNKKHQIITYANIGKYDSIFIIFEKINGKYQEVYSKKSWFISSVEINSLNIVLKILESSGTGFSSYYYYIIRYTPNGFKEVWRGLAHKYELFPREYNFETICSLNSYFLNQIIHFIVYNEYKGMDISIPIKSKQYYNIYEYNKNTYKYELKNTSSNLFLYD